MGINGYVHSLESFGAVDGPGIRFVVFLQGCPLRCLYCHNPDSRKSGGGVIRDSADLAEEILGYRAFLKNGGVTLSGGEPLAQADFAADILRRCRENGLHAAVDTSGAAPLSEAEKVLRYTDLVLLDIKSPFEETAERLTGKGIGGALAVLERCEEAGIEVWLRHVVVPGWTMNDSGAERLGLLAKKYRCVKKTELIPFHQMGKYKWAELGLEYKLSDTPVPTADEMEKLRGILRKTLES